MAKGYEGVRFFYAKAVEGVNAIFEECRWRFRRVFPSEPRTEQDTFHFDAFDWLNKRQNAYDEWEEIVANGDKTRLQSMTFIEFMGKLDREIRKIEDERRRQQEFQSKLKHR